MDMVSKGVTYIKSKWRASFGKFDGNKVARSIRNTIMGAMFSVVPLKASTNIKTYTPAERARQEQKNADKWNEVLT